MTYFLINFGIPNPQNMSISSISIERPVLTLVASIVIVLFGAIGFTYLGVREFPAVDPPTITVSANYVGANADVIESKITEPLEESLNGIAGVRSLTSISKEGASTITVEFELGIGLESAANDVRDRVSRARHTAPMPPSPSRRTIRQGPSRWPSQSGVM